LSYRTQHGPVLITGGAGFAGTYLADYLTKSGRPVHVIDRDRVAAYGENWNGTVVDRHVVDLINAKKLRTVLKKILPVEIYHLAGRANVKHSWHDESETYTANVIGAVNLMCAVRDIGLTCNMLIVSSGEVYGLVPEAEQPIFEQKTPAPRSPYAASKYCQEIACLQLARSIKGKTVVVRPFNHIGPGQRLGFVTADFGFQIARIENNLQEPVIHVGNLDARRDFTDVRDTVEGYVKALNFGQHADVINVSSGQAWSVKDILDTFVSRSTADITVRVDPARFRPADVPLLQGSYAYLNQISGWSPRHAVSDTLGNILDYWRERVLRSDVTRS
jgi:GDP-4-dehydro-6-deoxy-D-mannose reductase